MLVNAVFFARYLLKSQQIVGNVPPVVFIKDKEAAAVKEVNLIFDSMYKYSDLRES